MKNDSEVPLKEAVEILGAKELAKFINVNIGTIYNWIKADRNIYVQIECKPVNWVEVMK